MIVFIFLISFLFLSDAYADLVVSQDSQKHVLTDQDLHGLALKTVNVQDPVYGTAKRYAGYWLSDIFALAGVHPAADSVWTFSALDGYKVEVTAADVAKAGSKAFVAVRDLDAPQGWIKISQGKELVSPGPYYLVWQTPAPAEVKLPWPYEMAEISVNSPDAQAQQKLFPDDPRRSVSAARGYEIFKQNCISCHSLNLEGGGLGPELNVPKNVFEYEGRPFLKAFISDPSSFRARSKMPSFMNSLTEQQINDVLDYLAWMGKHK